MKNSLLLKLGFALVVVLAASTLIRTVKPQTAPNPVSLRVLATQSGNYVSYAQPSMFPKYADLNQLTAASTDVVIGTAGGNICRLSPDETSITTDFQVRVDSVIRGALVPGTTITVKVAGGRVGFNVPCATPPCVNPAIAEIRAPWFKKLTQGNQYYLFLYGAAKSSGETYVGFYPSGGPQGVFEITGGQVNSNSGRLRDPMWQYNGRSAADFRMSVQESNSIVPAISHP
jgi:hypothetical protein